MPCLGNSNDHCCYLSEGQVCPFLKEYSSGPRKWSCSLYEQYGSWKGVHNSEEYIENVKPECEKIAAKFNTPRFDCGDWPRPGEQCSICGLVG